MAAHSNNSKSLVSFDGLNCVCVYANCNYRLCSYIIKLSSKDLLAKYGGRVELVDSLIQDKVGHMKNYRYITSYTHGVDLPYGRLLPIYPNHIQSLAHGLILGCRFS